MGPLSPPTAGGVTLCKVPRWFAYGYVPRFVLRTFLRQYLLVPAPCYTFTPPVNVLRCRWRVVDSVYTTPSLSQRSTLPTLTLGCAFDAPLTGLHVRRVCYVRLVLRCHGHKPRTSGHRFGVVILPYDSW